MMSDAILQGMVAIVVRCAIGFLFVVTCSLKVAEPASLALTLRELGFNARALSFLTLRQWALVIAIAEGMLGIVLLLGWSWATTVAAAFLLGATAALIVLRRRGYDASCGCFGALEVSGGVGRWKIATNCALVCAACWSSWAAHRDGMRPQGGSVSFGVNIVPMMAAAVFLAIGATYVKRAFFNHEPGSFRETGGSTWG